MTSLSDSTNFLMDSKLEAPSTFNSKGVYESGKVLDAPHMNIVETKGYPEKLTFKNVFPPVCLKSHWDPAALSKYVLPETLASGAVPLPVDPRPLFRNCINYFNLTPQTAETKHDATVRAAQALQVQPGGLRSPYEVYVNNIDKESDLLLNHPQDRCDNNKWTATEDSDLYVNRHKPTASASALAIDRPLVTIANKTSGCRAAFDKGAWNRSARFFNNPTREDRMPGHAARRSEAPLSSMGAMTARVATVPRVWTNKSVVFYVDSHAGFMSLASLAAGLRDLKYEVTIFSTDKTSVQEGINYHHVTSFVPNDVYSTIVLWGPSALLDNFQYKPQARAIILALEEAEDSEFVCSRAVKDMVNKIVVKSAFHRSLYNCYTWSKFEVIPSGLPAALFVGPNRLLAREPRRVLITEYSEALVPFIQHAWVRVLAEFPDAELHIWETAGDDKKKVMPLLLALNKGVSLHGMKDLEGMIAERFMSRCQVYLEDYDQVSCDSVRLSALAGCIPIMPERGVYTELRGINVPGPVTKPEVLVDYAKAISTLFKNGDYARSMQIRSQTDPALSGHRATAERWIKIINGLQ